MNLLGTGAAGFGGSRSVRTRLAADAPDAPRSTVPRDDRATPSPEDHPTAPRPAYSALAHGRRQDIGPPAPRDRRVALHEAPPRIRKESPLRETP
ncbi:hypothetical protein ACFYY3_25900 [Streptomyces sp. NPDC001812]|uniref:hypothetical protein n=1 Tax=Streptomyces sp. NPDC001812 TaxID=3364611 RepID=UPI0036A65CC5